MNTLTTVEEGARILGVSRLRLYQMIREQIVPRGVYVRFGTRQLRINLEQLHAWIDQGGTLSNFNDEEWNTFNGGRLGPLF